MLISINYPASKKLKLSGSHVIVQVTTVARLDNFFSRAI